MPIYEYHCNACGHEFEVMQKITDPPIRKCEKCGKKKAKKMISQSSFVLNGSGWYVTDYGGKKPSKSEPHLSETGERKAADKDEPKTPAEKESAAPAKETKNSDSLKKAANG